MDPLRQYQDPDLNDSHGDGRRPTGQDRPDYPGLKRGGWKIWIWVAAALVTLAATYLVFQRGPVVEMPRVPSAGPESAAQPETPASQDVTGSSSTVEFQPAAPPEEAGSGQAPVAQTPVAQTQPANGAAAQVPAADTKVTAGTTTTSSSAQASSGVKTDAQAADAKTAETKSTADGKSAAAKPADGKAAANAEAKPGDGKAATSATAKPVDGKAATSAAAKPAEDKAATATAKPVDDKAAVTAGAAEAKPAIETAAKPTPEEPKAEISDLWTVNIYSTPDPADSLKFLSKVIGQEVNGRVYSTTAVLEGQTYYRIRVGFYKTKEEAQAAGQKLAETYKLTSNPWIVQPTVDEVKKANAAKK